MPVKNQYHLNNHRKRNIGAFIIVLFFLSLACGNSGSNAEATNTALQATNTAQELEFLKLTATAQANNAPESPVIETQVTPGEIAAPADSSDNGDTDNTSIQFPTPPPAPPENVLFFDDFSNNNNGWDLTTKDKGSVGFVQQSLVIAVPSDTCLIAPIPNFNVGADYYIEADVKVTRSDHVILGYAFGSDSAYYKYGLGLSGTRGIWGVFGYLINDAPGKPSSQIDMGTKLWDNNTTFVLGMEVSGGGYNLYLNGEPISSSQFQPDGNRIGVFTCAPRGYTDEVRFDNLVIREWR